MSATSSTPGDVGTSERWFFNTRGEVTRRERQRDGQGGIEDDDVPDGWADRVDHATAGGERLLVRPDGYVAWSAGDGDLRAALARWCGPPA